MFQYNQVFGDDKIGFNFRANYKGDYKYFDFATFYNYFQRNDFLSFFFYPWNEQEIKQNDFNLYFNPSSSANKAAKFTFNYGISSQNVLFLFCINISS